MKILFQPSTKRQVGQTVQLHYLSHNTLRFELLKYPGKMLRVTSTGKVEFASVQDDTSTFELEATISGALYFRCMSYLNETNIEGTSKGWYLSMSDQGQLYGNGAKTDHSLWTLLTVSDSTDPSSNNNNNNNAALNSSNTNNTSNYRQLVDYNNNNNNNNDNNNKYIDNAQVMKGSFPGIGSGREALMTYFLTPSGTKFLQQPEYRVAYQLFRNGAILSKILHR